MIKITIIVPLYNNQKLITRCLNSIELRDDIEIIVIDDCSVDKSYEMAELWQTKNQFKNFMLIRNDTNKGIGHVINQAYDIAKGEYLVTLCDDDYFIKPLSCIIPKLDGTDLVYYDLEINSGEVLRGCYLPGASKFYKKTIIGDTRRIDKDFGGDKIFYQEILDKNPTVHDTRITLYHYDYPREGSLMDRWWDKGEQEPREEKNEVIYE